MLVEQLLGSVAPEPRLELRQVLGIRAHLRQRHLVRAPRSLDRQPVHRLRARPALRRAQHDHRPARPLGSALDAGGALDGGYLLHDGVEHLGHAPVHRLRLVAVDPVDGVAVALEQRRQLVVADPCEHRRVGDLVPVQVQDRQHRAVAGRIEELVRMPAGGERAGLRLAVADDAADEQIWIVECCAVRVSERVAELASLVDRTGSLGRDVRRDPAGERELAEQPAQPFLVLRDLRIDLGVRPLEVGVRHRRRAAVPGTHHVDRVEVPVPDHPVHVHVDEVQARRRPPVAEKARLDVLGLQRLAQQRVLEEIDLPDRDVVRGTPVRVHQVKLGVAECVHRVPSVSG